MGQALIKGRIDMKTRDVTIDSDCEYVVGFQMPSLPDASLDTPEWNSEEDTKCLISLSRGYFAIIDSSDAERVSEYKFYFSCF